MPCARGKRSCPHPHTRRSRSHLRVLRLETLSPDARGQSLKVSRSSRDWPSGKECLGGVL
jgi:hypothetical protein